MNENKKKQARGAVPEDTGRQAGDLQAAETQAGDFDRQVMGDILHGFNAGTWKWNLRNGEVECSDKWAEIAGYPAEELSPSTIDSWMQLVHPDDVSTTQRASGKPERQQRTVCHRIPDAAQTGSLDVRIGQGQGFILVQRRKTPGDRRHSPGHNRAEAFRGKNEQADAGVRKGIQRDTKFYVPHRILR